MTDLSVQFLEVRKFMLDAIEPMFQVCVGGIWDPLSFFTITKYIDDQLKKEVATRFPDFPIKHIPKHRFLVNHDEKNIELSIQEHLNETTHEMHYLGSCGMYGHIYDLYVRESYTLGPPILYARYGHDSISCIDGTYEGESDYFEGKITPLSIAYEMARDAGYFKHYVEEQEKIEQKNSE